MTSLGKYEKRYINSPCIKTATSYALCLWLTYAVRSASDSREYLLHAYRLVYTQLRKNESYLPFYWLRIFFAIELRNFDTANEMLDNIYPYRNFYKNNQPFDYKILLFLYAYYNVSNLCYCTLLLDFP